MHTIAVSVTNKQYLPIYIVHIDKIHQSHKESLINRALPFVVAVATGDRVAAVVSADLSLVLLASASALAVSSEAPVAVEDAWLPAVSVAPQTAYAREGLAGLACIGILCEQQYMYNAIHQWESRNNWVGVVNVTSIKK